MTIEIRNCDGEVVLTSDHATVREAVKAAVQNLSSADLSGAVLDGRTRKLA